VESNIRRQSIAAINIRTRDKESAGSEWSCRKVPVVKIFGKAPIIHHFAARSILGDIERGECHYPKISHVTEGSKLGCLWSLQSKWTTYVLTEGKDDQRPMEAALSDIHEKLSVFNSAMTENGGPSYASLGHSLRSPVDDAGISSSKKISTPLNNLQASPSLRTWEQASHSLEKAESLSERGVLSQLLAFQMTAGSFRRLIKAPRKGYAQSLGELLGPTFDSLLNDMIDLIPRTGILPTSCNEIFVVVTIVMAKLLRRLFNNSEELWRPMHTNAQRFIQTATGATEIQVQHRGEEATLLILPLKYRMLEYLALKRFENAQWVPWKGKSVLVQVTVQPFIPEKPKAEELSSDTN
jgi:hypothetical protein